MKKKCTFLSLVLFSAFTAFSQGKGSVSGTVIDPVSGDPLPGVNILVQGTQIGTSTERDGKFKIILQPGRYTLQMRFLGYKTLTEPITVKADEAQRFKVKLVPESNRLSDVTVTAQSHPETQSALLLEQKKAVVIKQSIGAVELSQRGVSDAAAAVSKISGVSRQRGSQALVVRGLGDRYNNAYLNGLPLPSNVPTKKLIDLGIFKTGIVRNISVYKTFNSRLYGDYAGASFDIQSREAPQAFTLALTAGLGTNSQTLGKDLYLQKGGSYDFFGFDDGSRRESPYLNLKADDGSATLFKSRDYVSAGVPFEKPLFHTGFDPVKQQGPVNANLGISAGKTFALPGHGTLGFFAAARFSNAYRNYEDGYEASYNRLGQALSRYGLANKYAYNTNTTGLLNVKYAPDANNRITFNSLLIHTSSNTLRQLFGANPIDKDSLFVQRGTFRQSDLFTEQLLGNHRFQDDRLVLDWGASYNQVNDRMPDRKQNILGYQRDAEQWTFSLSNNNPSYNQRYWQDIVEKAENGRIDLTWRLGQDAGLERNLTLGADFQSRDFNFVNHQANYEVLDRIRDQSQNLKDLDSPLGLRNLNKPAGYDLQEQPNTGRFIKGSLETYAAYLSTSLALNEKLTLSGGLRLEASDQRTFFRLRTELLTKPMHKVEQNKHFLLPDLNLKWALSENANLRLATSYTLTRPQFLELAPFLYEDITESTSGNPNLKNSKNLNFDLKYECFPNAAEIFSLTAFAKHIQDPIEKVWTSGAGNVKTYINSKSALVYGAEFELEKKLIPNLSLGFNASYIYTHSETDPETTVPMGSDAVNITVTTADDKALQGASNLLLNADLTYALALLKGVKTTATADYSYTGKRLTAIGGNDIGNEYQRPISGLNFILKNEISKKYALNLSVGNILNAVDERYIDQRDLKQQNITHRYKSGVDFSLSFSYRF